MWVARNKNGSLYIYQCMPKRTDNEWHQTALYENSDGVIEELDNVRLNKNLFPNLKWEDPPINVELYHKINYNEEHILQQALLCYQ